MAVKGHSNTRTRVEARERTRVFTTASEIRSALGTDSPDDLIEGQWRFNSLACISNVIHSSHCFAKPVNHQSSRAFCISSRCQIESCKTLDRELA